MTGRHRRTVQAVRAAIYDRLAAKDAISPLSANTRIDGKACLVTGANSGLGKAVAIDLATRGARVLMACRSGHPTAAAEVRSASGSTDVEQLTVDLADLESVHGLCDELRDRRTKLDVAVLNAGVMSRVARRSKDGFEVMFAVHFLANRAMVERWLQDAVIDLDAEADNRPRIVQVTSETHRSSDPIDFDRFGEFSDYGMRDALKHYALSKLHSCTFARELDRRLNPGEPLRVAVHAVCPGPIASNIAREAPGPLKLLLSPLMRLFFSRPARAARPVSYLCCAAEAGRRSGIYLHMMQEKEPSPLALDPRCGARLWEASQNLLDRHIRHRQGH